MSRKTRLAVARTLTLLIVGATAAGCARQGDRTASEGRPSAAVFSVADWEIVDLTHPLSPDSLYWPNGSPFEFEREAWGLNDQGKWYAMARFATPEHLGTHLDAPIHFAADAWTNAEIPVRRFIGPAVVIDITDRAHSSPDAVLLASDIERWETRHGTVPEGAIVIVRSGWSERWPDWNRYYGSEDPFDTTTLHFPGVSPEAAEIIVARGAGGVGIDTASIDPGNDLDFRAHRVLAEAGLFNLENLKGLDPLPESGATLVALPIKIEGGTGGPARVVALIPAAEPAVSTR